MTKNQNHEFYRKKQCSFSLFTLVKYMYCTPLQLQVKFKVKVNQSLNNCLITKLNSHSVYLISFSNRIDQLMAIEIKRLLNLTTQTKAIFIKISNINKRKIFQLNSNISINIEINELSKQSINKIKKVNAVGSSFFNTNLNHKELI